MGRDTEKAEAALHDQEQLLPKKELLIVFGIMSLELLVCFIDQNGIGVLLPDIARDLNASDTISWAGTSTLIANTVFQVLYGRLSDLFGRKNILISALVLLSLSDLACGLSVNSTMLYIFRGLAGVANGGITSLTMMIVSDIVTLQERGKYQGILGAMVGLGNALGPLIASAFTLHTTWRGLFYLLAPLIMVTVAGSWVFLPSNMPKLNLKETISKIDFLGLFWGTAAVILLLIPISSGGNAGTPWDSPQVIAMLVVGGVCLLAFLFSEWKLASLPMMPLSIFRKPSVAAMLAQSFLLGACYYSYLYFIPLYYQNVRGRTPLIAACLQLPLVFAQSSFSTMSGLYMSRFNRYGEIIWGGFGIWTVGAGLLTLADEHIHIGLICFFLVLVGFGTGMVFQPTLVALQAHCPKAQRAVIVSNRNFLRSSGGAVGLAVSSAILGNVLKGALPQRLHYVAQSTFAAPDLSTFSAADQTAIKSAYASASRAVFIWCVPCVGVCFLLCSLIKDGGLQRKEEKEAALPQASDEKTPRHSIRDEEKCPSAEEPVETDSRSKDPGANVSRSANSTDVSPKPSALSLKSESSR
ncbi:putative major facilitator superfamily transporter [Hortaea werneckii]|nr:putative major facilitator superfamily transporter [Hortaea werneckii]